ncbi:M-phase phosphoprotein 9 isoform X2 [Cyclopterus lumpus]|uniref:M-phase phosphoprotein 9 isoform X2 n=1 Tax=Cyclopterus lumpus TaxID=8103 RepID=UPI001486E4F2|nr:M-phase phosphoprotein 9 isoform X2 [Cyclopterus lumpus]
MSTDDSISEDVSSSGALSHCHVSPDGDGGKESETSLVSSEGTSASGLAVSEDRHTTSQTAGGAVESRPVDITPACNKIRSLCLNTEEAFDQGKILPFINPSSLETFRALVQEIQSSGETDPEIWKDCEGRWLHLFQLVEKQYQEQILAQQEQYQCQIQLIQDEIKALVQLQNRQASSVQPQADFSPTVVTKTTPNTKDYIFPLISSHCWVPVASDNESLAAPALIPFSSPYPPPQRPETRDQGEERATTVLSSGYGTLSAWETGLEPAGSPGEDEDGFQGREKHHWSPHLQEDTQTNVIRGQQDILHVRNIGVDETNPPDYQQRTFGTRHFVTSWAQRQKLRPKKSKAGQASSQIPEYEEPLLGLRESHKQTPPDGSDLQDQRPAGLPSSSFPLRRSDSLMSEASGLTYWRLTESELYHPLPDSFDSGAYHLLQEASLSLTPSQEPRLSLREIYQNKQRTDCKRSDWDGSATSSPSSPQVSAWDPAANQRQSDRTSGFTSPSHFSSPSYAAQPHHYPRVGTPGTPDSTVECGPNPGDTDCISNTSSASAAGQSLWGNATQAPPFTLQGATHSHSHTSSQQRGASGPSASEEEGTHTSTLKPRSASGASLRPSASPHMQRASSLEDPVTLSLLRQNLREKHSRHVADLKAYYESEIQSLRDKLNLRDLPRDLEKSNRVLTERCKQLEKALSGATGRVQELEATNSSLEKELVEWPDRYAVAGAAVKSSQQRLEESKRSGKEKDALAASLKTRARQLEEALQKTCREADEREARRDGEYKMLQELLGQYDSLVKEHEGLKSNQLSTENKLFNATDQISELKRVISKLESQVKQLEHENQARARYSSHNNTQPSGAGLLHHPDLLMSPSKCTAEPDVTRRKSPSDQLNGGRKSPFLQTNQSSVHRKSKYSMNDQSSVTGSSVDSWRCASPPECEQAAPQQRQQEQSQREAARREGSCSLTPMMRALIQLEETRATESRAPCKNSSTTHRVGNQRTAVGFVERRRKEVIQERGGLQADREAVKPGGVAARGGGGGGAGGGAGGAAKRAAALLRAPRSLSPEGHRSSSLPPPEHRSKPSTTPTKRGTLLMPMSARSSPKRCPTENYSTAFGHLMPREEHLHKRSDGQVDRRRHSLHSSGARKRLQFTSADGEDGVNPPEGNSQLGWEDQGVRGGSDPQDSCADSAPLLQDSGLHSPAEAERLFDELTQEKLQIEAALSRMPGAGGRVTLQTRLDEVALENRLERLNRELGSIRMTLKRFHVLRSSANT